MGMLHQDLVMDLAATACSVREFLLSVRLTKVLYVLTTSQSF